MNEVANPNVRYIRLQIETIAENVTLSRKESIFSYIGLNTTITLTDF